MRDYPRYKFKARIPELLRLEGEYNSFDKFTISCRHKDILNAGNTRHFTSCYRSDGFYNRIPFIICMDPNIAILGNKDRSGQYLWRAFLRFRRFPNEIVIHKIYGNPPADICEIIRLELHDELGSNCKIYFSIHDCSPQDLQLHF